jgi:4-hydroxybenzoate polyprenyltransferase
VRQFGLRGFDYVGNSHDDLPVWKIARQAIVVNASASVLGAAQLHGNVTKLIGRTALTARDMAKMLRVHQWMKNLLLFVPLMAAHQLTQGPVWGTVLLAFLSFSLCASAVYISNDLLDLGSDRQHLRKRQRPFASGRVPVAWGVAIAPMLAAASVALAAVVGPRFLAWLAVYFVLTCWYSLTLKRLALLDCLTLACLYTLRIVAGGAAAALVLSQWLLVVSGFVFLSLSFLKRYTELRPLAQQGENTFAHGRGYTAQDANLVQLFGVAAGYASAVVLALYLHGDTAKALYAQPHALLVTVGVLVYWISWMWLQSHRGNMHDDPVVFAVKDGVSLACGASFAASLVVATIGWPL